MERRNRIVQGVRNFLGRTSEVERDLQDLMVAFGTNNTKGLPREVRTTYAIKAFKGFVEKTGRIYDGGDVPTLGLWYAIERHLGADALSDVVKNGLVDPKFLGRVPLAETPQQYLQKRVSELEDLGRKGGWKQ